ncbi:hypothetical protein Q8F55_007952 [Vanrija albida]|uniref:Major facilitator superfamily (MFS) profile domain-containing protein n=1 Tax=Vanrija albida TaxID=181172 RepID=A0ABR3PV00_9TREE
MGWNPFKANAEAPDLVTDEIEPPTLDPQAEAAIQKSKEEKRFLLKLDIFLLTFGCISQIIKYLDQTNINTAYVSGMSDALNFNGNELNYFKTYFNIGYCLFLIPSQVIITRVRPSIWLPALEFIWGALTGVIAACTTSKQIYGVRALIGLAESSCYPGTVTMLMTWYTPLEMAKRIGFYHSCQAFGGMMSSAMQTGIIRGLEGRHGIQGWQWTFIINCIMTIIASAWSKRENCPSDAVPNKLAFWLTERDYEIAQARLRRFRRESPNPINWPTFWRMLKNPILYIMIWIYVGMLLAQSAGDYFQLWLRALVHPDGTKVWSRTMLNAIPLGGYALQIAAVWFWSFSSDILKTRWTILLAQCIIGIPGAIIMTVWNVPDAAKYYSYFILYCVAAGGPPLWAWLSDMLPSDAEQRALILGTCITAFYAINAWANILIYPAKEAPHYKFGWPVSLALWITCALWVVALRIYDIKVVRPRNFRAAQEAFEAAEAEVRNSVEYAVGDNKVDAKVDDKDAVQRV